jgi:hypothetical protein
MIASADFTLDRRYFENHYSDWIRFRSKFRKFAPLIGAALLILGGMLLFLPKRHFGIAFIAIGIVYLIDVLTYGRRWVRQRLSAGGSSSAHVEFYEDRVFMKTDSGEGYYLLSGFIYCIPADQGVFLYPQKDISFYIPWNSIVPPESIPKVRELLVSRGAEK